MNGRALHLAQSQPLAQPQRPAVVLLHSSASSARQWQSLTETLQPRYRVLTVDLHGHGARPEWSGDSPLALADEAALVEPLLAQVGSAHLVGHSYGAAVALKVATLFPARVRSLVAYEPVLFRLLLDDAVRPRPGQDVIAAADRIRERLSRDDAEAAAKEFIEFWSGAGAWRSMSAGRRQAIAIHMPSVMRHFDALFHEPAMRAQMARLRMPMLVLTGAHTVPATRRIGELLRAALPTAHHETLPEMTHLGPITHGEDFNDWVAEFLYAVASDSPGALYQQYP